MKCLLSMLAIATSIGACASTVSPGDGAPVVDAGDIHDIVDAVPVDAGPCGDAACPAGQICVRGRCGGCCELPPTCVPIPSGCHGTLACGCFATDPCGGCTTCGSVEADGVHCINCMCMCAAPWTPIATPDGDRDIASLRVGDLVYSIDRGARVAVPVARIHRTPVSRHTMVRVRLASGDTLEISAGHPTADGRQFDELAPGDRLGEARVLSVETVEYEEPFTYDILPASDTGTYFAAGAWIGSTLGTHVP